MRLACPMVGLLLLGACGSGSGSTGSSSPRPSPPLSRGPSPLALSDATIAAPDNQPFILFQTSYDARLRGLTWNGTLNGVFTRSGQFGLSSESPDGRFALVRGMLTDRYGRNLGPFPWPGKDPSVTWSADGVMCRAVPTSNMTGAVMQLQVAVPGGSPRTVAKGYAAYSDNASFPVLACDLQRDRAIVAEFGQAMAPAAVWIIRLSTNTVIRFIGTPGSLVSASSDATLIARSSIPTSPGQMASTTIERADDGTILGTVNNLEAHGFSGDNSLLVGLSGTTHLPVVVDWQTGRRIWAAPTGPWFGYLTEPRGSHVLIGAGSVNGYMAHAYLIGPDGTNRVLPADVQLGLRY